MHAAPDAGIDTADTADTAAESVLGEAHAARSGCDPYRPVRRSVLVPRWDAAS